MLRIVELNKTYPNGVQALSNVTLTVPKGMFGLLGPNGAGKSTLMRTIATLQVPDSGNVQLHDLDVLADPTTLRRTLGYLPQEFGAYPRTSPKVMLDHLCVLKGVTQNQVRAQMVEQLLVETNLWDVRNKSIDTFSGGMKQRFGIAQALIGKPDLIIVDEPTAGLDPAERRRFHNLLAQIGEDVVVILSTHIVDDVADLCPQMAIMGGGKILLQGEPLPLTSALSGQLWSITLDLESAKAATAQYQPVSSRMVAGRMELRVVATTSPGDGFIAVEPSLEDLYFHTLAEHELLSDDVEH